MAKIDHEEFRAAAQALLKATDSVAMVAICARADESGFGVCAHGSGLMGEEHFKIMTKAMELLRGLTRSSGCTVSQEDSFASVGPDHGTAVRLQ